MSLVQRESLPGVSLRGATTVTVTIGASHNESAVIAASTVRMIATAACFVDIGAAPVADNTKMYLAPNVPELFKFNSGDKVSVLQSVGGGTLYISYGS